MNDSMSACTSLVRRPRVVIAAVLAVAPFAALAGHAPNGSPERVVGILDAGYLADGRSYATLDALDAAVRAGGPASMRIVSCTPTSTAHWLAAVRRFDDLPIHVEVADGSSPACAVAVPPGAEVDGATRQYWSARQP